MMSKVLPTETEAAQAFMCVLFSSGLLDLVKVLEVVSGQHLISGFFVALVLLVLAPIIVNSAFFHVALGPSWLKADPALWHRCHAGFFGPTRRAHARSNEAAGPTGVSGADTLNRTVTWGLSACNHATSWVSLDEKPTKGSE